jgi:hypothetical protein
MANPDDRDSDEIDLSPDDLLTELKKQIAEHERILREFKIAGSGIAGSVEKGFTYNP